MKRRGFLGLLAGAVAAPFVPAPTVKPHTVGWFGSTPLVNGRIWSNSEACYRETVKVGDTITVRLPQRFLVRNDLAYQPPVLR